MWCEVNQAIRAGTDNNDTEWQYLYVLLEFKIAIERYKYFACTVRAAQELAVLDAGPTVIMHV